MKITFLGHQGWVFEHEGGTTLLDPICEAMGNGAVRLPVWPERRIDFSAVARIERIIISHEHGDHFDIRTLSELPFRGEAVIPLQSSTAMESVLREMGFAVCRMRPLERFSSGELSFMPMPTSSNDLERDVYGLLVQEPPSCSFLTFVDGVPCESAIEWLLKHCPQRTIDNFTNNSIEPLPHLSDLDWKSDYSAAAAFRPLLDFVETFDPRHVLISGQGWSYPQHIGFLNNRLFRVTNTQLGEAARVLFPATRWDVPVPGDAFSLRDGKQVSFSKAPWIVHRHPTDRTFQPPSLDDPIAPYSRLETLSDEQLEQCRCFIVDEFGAILCTHSPALGGGLHSLFMEAGPDLRPALFFRLLNKDRWEDFVLEYGDRQFHPVQTKTNPFEAYVAGFEMWASDFNLLFRAEEEAHLIYETAVRTWNHRPDVLPFYLASSIFAWFNPFFRPTEYLKAYRRFHFASVLPATGRGG